MADPAIIYLDVDDEITAAASRIRAAEPAHIAIVIPPGSHIATSRINFRLLAREAVARNRRLSVIAPDAASRAIAASAGLEVHASVGAFETALAAGGSTTIGETPPAMPAATPLDGTPDGEPIAGATFVAGAAASGPPTMDELPPVSEPETAPAATDHVAPSTPTAEAKPGPSSAAPGRSSAPAARTGTIVAPVGRRRSRRLIIGTLVVVGIVVAAGVGAAMYLPTATITITPRPETVGPVELTVSADPAATTVDAAGGIIPATTVSFPISVGQSFPATGKRVEESRATGQVTFDSVNTVGPVAVPSGTRVSTLGGVVFATTKGATVPKATVAGTTIKHGTVTVPVRATKAGPEGNVEGGEITQVPDFLSTQQVSANNAKATSGGKRTEFAQVTKKDVDAAVKALEVEAARAFADAVAASAGVPASQTLFPATAVLGPLVYEPAPASLIGDEAESFELAATANGTATAVDVSQVEAIAEERLLSGIAAGAQLVPGSVEVSIGAPVITGSVVTFPVTATASQIRPVDAEDLEAEILGLSIEQAEAALARYGAVTIEVWPDLVTSIPTNDSRVTITVVGGVTPSAAPSSPPP